MRRPVEPDMRVGEAPRVGGMEHEDMGTQQGRQPPDVAQSLDLEAGRVGSEEELGHFMKGPEGQGETQHPTQSRATGAQQ